MIQSLVYFLVQKGLALSRVESWSMASVHSFSDYISSQSVSELLRGIKENDRQRFFASWLNQVSDQDCLCYDITSISSYGRNNEYMHWGYNRDGNLPGNISEATTLKKALCDL